MELPPETETTLRGPRTTPQPPFATGYTVAAYDREALLAALKSVDAAEAGVDEAAFSSFAAERSLARRQLKASRKCLEAAAAVIVPLQETPAAS